MEQMITAIKIIYVMGISLVMIELFLTTLRKCERLLDKDYRLKQQYVLAIFSKNRNN